MGTLREQAGRFVKRRYHDANQLAHDVYLALLQQEDVDPPSNQPIAVDLGDGLAPLNISPNAFANPLNIIRVPDLEVAEMNRGGRTGSGFGPDGSGFTSNVTGVELNPDEEAAADTTLTTSPTTRKLLVATRVYHQRVVVPGIMIGVCGKYGTVRLFPAGYQNNTGSNYVVTGVEQIGFPATGVANDNGIGVLVWRYTDVEVNFNRLLDSNIEESKYITILVKNRRHEIAGPLNVTQGFTDWVFRSDGDVLGVPGGLWTKINANSVKCAFETSSNCIASNNGNTQIGTAAKIFTLAGSKTLEVLMTGSVEASRPGYDYGEVRVDGARLIWDASDKTGLKCKMEPRTKSTTKALAGGDHWINIYCDTKDEFNHVGGFWKFELSFT